VTSIAPRQTRILGALLIAYGTLGVLVIVGALAIGAPAIARVERLVDAAVATTNSASRAANAAADAFDGFGQSMERARTSASDAAAVSREAAATSSSLADAMDISIFGAQPLLGLSDDFRATSDQLQGLAVDLDEIGLALVASDDDLVRVESSLRLLAADLFELRGRIGAQSAEPSIALNLLFYAFLAWQALPALASLMVGVVLLRRSDPAAP
jgi:hypothetical protein